MKFYLLTEYKAPPIGAAVTWAFVSCAVCGSGLSHQGGPCLALCAQCLDVAIKTRDAFMGLASKRGT